MRNRLSGIAKRVADLAVSVGAAQQRQCPKCHGQPTVIRFFENQVPVDDHLPAVCACGLALSYHYVVFRTV